VKLSKYRISVICLLITLMLLFAMPAMAALGGSQIKDTVHNLSTSGSGTIKSGTENKICVFCHTPHNSNPSTAIWNHNSQNTYTMYDSTVSETLDATVSSVPDGSSKLCLSCHDGTIAIGDLNDMDVSVGDSGTGKLDASGAFADTANVNKGTNLTNDHPISLIYDSTLANGDSGIGNLKDPSASSGLGGTIQSDMLDENSKMQCTSCHDPHDNSNGKFLIMKNDDGTYGGTLCLVCHSRGDPAINATWADSIHRNSTGHEYAMNGVTKSVALWGCGSCHSNHDVSVGNPRLKRNVEENDCYKCHDSNSSITPAVPGIEDEFNKSWTHPIENQSGVHYPGEPYDADDLNQPTRHVECMDCHDPHAAQTEASHKAAPNLPASLMGIDGVAVTFTGPWGNVSFSRKQDIDEEYELCLKCHSSYNYGSNPPTSPSREYIEGADAWPQSAIAKQLNPNNGSYHAVMGPRYETDPGRGGDFVGTDRSGNPWGWTSQLLCTDCHGNDSATDPVQGPHGSGYFFILKAPWSRGTGPEGESGTGSSGTSDHLCFNCHDWNTYAGGDASGSSGFSNGSENLHAKHDGRACITCHSTVPHGFEPKYPDGANDPNNLEGKAMLVERDEPSPYSDGSFLEVVNWRKSGNWGENDCSAHNSSSSYVKFGDPGCG